MGFWQLQKYGLYANLKKCRFSNDEIHFLGFIISLSEVYIETKHIDSINNWPEPESIREIQVFIGFANFYRQFIQNFSTISGPLILMLKIGPGSRSFKLIKKSIKTLFQPNLTLFFNPEAKESFERLKKAFFKKPVLQHFDVSKPIRLKTNASGKVIEGMLCQQNKEIYWHPIVYYLPKMLFVERNYKTHNVKLLVIVESFKTWHD